MKKPDMFVFTGGLMFIIMGFLGFLLVYTAGLSSMDQTTYNFATRFAKIMAGAILLGATMCIISFFKTELGGYDTNA